MPTIDRVIAKSFGSKIKKNLESKTEERVKLRLFKKYGLSIRQSIEDFSKLDNVLREFLKSDAQKFEQDCLSEIMTFSNANKGFIRLSIIEKSLVEQFLEMLGDRESRKILEQTLQNSLLISEILNACNISQTSGYRKINAMIRNGFLVKTGQEMTDKKRAISKFSMFCTEVSIDVTREKHVVNLIVPKKVFEESTVIQTIMN